MKTSDQAKIVSTILLISICGIHGITIKLSALRPDLEYLRGYWLQNADQSDREGRIIFFSNESQIVVDFEKSTNPIQDEAWSKDYLRLNGIHDLPESNTAKSVDELYYKHGSFYIRRNPYALPEALSDSENNDLKISTLPISSEDDGKNSVQIQYVYLSLLASKIDSKIKEMNATNHSSFVALTDGDNAFPFNFVKSRTQLYVRHVRVIPCVKVEVEVTKAGHSDLRSPVPPPPPYRTLASLGYPRPEPYTETRKFESKYVSSEEMPFIRFDRNEKKFYSVRDSELDQQSFIRSSVGTYIIRDVKTKSVDHVHHPRPE